MHRTGLRVDVVDVVTVVVVAVVVGPILVFAAGDSVDVILLTFLDINLGTSNVLVLLPFGHSFGDAAVCVLLNSSVVCILYSFTCGIHRSLADSDVMRGLSVFQLDSNGPVMSGVSAGRRQRESSGGGD